MSRVVLDIMCETIIVNKSYILYFLYHVFFNLQYFGFHAFTILIAMTSASSVPEVVFEAIKLGRDYKTIACYLHTYTCVLYVCVCMNYFVLGFH